MPSETLRAGSRAYEGISRQQDPHHSQNRSHRVREGIRDTEEALPGLTLSLPRARGDQLC